MSATTVQAEHPYGSDRLEWFKGRATREQLRDPEISPGRELGLHTRDALLLKGRPRKEEAGFGMIRKAAQWLELLTQLPPFCEPTGKPCLAQVVSPHLYRGARYSPGCRPATCGHGPHSTWPLSHP